MSTFVSTNTVGTVMNGISVQRLASKMVALLDSSLRARSCQLELFSASNVLRQEIGNPLREGLILFESLEPAELEKLLVKFQRHVLLHIMCPTFAR